MERIENVAFYIVNKSIELAREKQDKSYLMDYDKLLGVIMLAQIKSYQILKQPLVNEDFYLTKIGLRIKDESDRYTLQSGYNANSVLRIKLLPFEANNGSGIYDKKCYEIDLDTITKTILDEQVANARSINPEYIKNYIDFTFGTNKNNIENFVITKEELANAVPPVLNNPNQQMIDYQLFTR